MPIETAKVLEKIDTAVKKCSDAETLKLLAEVKADVAALSNERDDQAKQNKELSDSNHKLTEAVKQSIISGPAKPTPEDKNGGSPNPAPKSFEEMLKENYEKAQKGKEK